MKWGQNTPFRVSDLEIIELFANLLKSALVPSALRQGESMHVLNGLLLFQA